MSHEDDKQNTRFVFRISLPTLRKLKEHCSTYDNRSQSVVIRRAIASANDSLATAEDAKTWKLLCPRGADMVSVWADKDLVAGAKERAKQSNISLNQYIERALKSFLTTA